MDKYERHYAATQTSDLLRKLLEHKLQTQPLGKEWADGLLRSLEKQNLQGAYRQIFVRIQDTDVVQLGEQADAVNKSIDDLQTEENRHNPLEIDPVKIADAGKTMKMMARIASFFLIAGVVIAIISACDVDYGTRATLLGLLGFGGLIANFLFLGLLHNAGSTLQDSVRRKHQ